MNILTLVPVALSLLASLVSAEDDKHCKPPQPHPCGGRCTKEEAEKKAVSLQKELQRRLQACDFLGARELSLPTASYSTTDQFCSNGGCCSDVGSMDVLWSFYGCQDLLIYPYVPNAVEHLPNGTIIIHQPELTPTWDESWNRTFFAYNEFWWWFPVKSETEPCDFRLGYLTGNSYNCPKVLPSYLSCADPVCTGE